MAKRTLLIPAMLDDHFPLLLPAFQSRRYDAVVLDNREGLAALGLRCAQNDLCYPGILIIGQVLSALNSGRWDPAAASLLIPQAGDACRGSNYLSMIRKALDRGGWRRTGAFFERGGPEPGQAAPGVSRHGSQGPGRRRVGGRADAAAQPAGSL